MCVTGDPLRRPDLREFVLFCLVGASGYVVNLVVFRCVYGAGADHLVSATAAFPVAMTNNYLLNRRWTFPGALASSKRVQAPRFFAVSVAALLLGLGVLEALLEATQAPALLAQASAILVVTPVGFAGQKLWSFRPVGGWRAPPVERAAR